MAVTVRFCCQSGRSATMGACPAGRAAGRGAARPAEQFASGHLGRGRGRVPRSRGAVEGDRRRRSRAAAAAAAGHVRHRRRPRAAGAGGHERCRSGTASSRSVRPRRDQRVRPGPVHPAGLSQPARAVPVTRRCPAGPARRSVLPGSGRWRPSTCRGRLRAGPAGHRARTGVAVGRAQLTGIAEDLAAWTGDPSGALSRRGRRTAAGRRCHHDAGRWQGIVMAGACRTRGRRTAPVPDQEDAVSSLSLTSSPLSASRRTSPPRPPAEGVSRPRRAGQVAVGVGHLEHSDMIVSAFDEADRRDPQRVRLRVFLFTVQAADHRHRGSCEGSKLKVSVLIDYIHVSGYIGKVAAALHLAARSRGPAARWTAAARPAAARSRRRHPAPCGADPREPVTPPRPHRHGQGRHLPDQQPSAHEI